MRWSRIQVCLRGNSGHAGDTAEGPSLTHLGHSRSAVGALELREEVVADNAPFIVDCEKADASGNHLAGFQARHIPPEFYDSGQRLDRRGGPEYIAFLDNVALIGCSHALLKRTMAPHILSTHKVPTIGHP